MWLYRLLLGFIHFILYIRFIISVIAVRIQLLATGVFGSRGTSFSEIHLHSKNLTKLPIHISFLVLEPEISFEDVAKLIVWSMAMGISYISIYDRKGKTIFFFHLQLYSPCGKENVSLIVSKFNE